MITPGILLVILSLSWMVIASQGKKCPDGFHHHGNSCYWFSIMTATFASARSVCQHLGGHLAIITSKDENDFIKAYARQRGKADFYFLGGSDIALEGFWKWEGGQPLRYNDWGPGQPDDYKPNGGEDCLGIWVASKYQWNDGVCKNMYNFICEVSM